MVEAYFQQIFNSPQTIKKTAIKAVTKTQKHIKHLLLNNKFQTNQKPKKPIQKQKIYLQVPTKPIFNSQSRRKYLQTQKLKAQQNWKFIQSVQQKHKEIRQRQKQRNKALTQRLLKVSQQQQFTRHQLQKHRQQQKKKHLQDLVEKKIKRKQDLAQKISQGNRNFSKVLKQVPLYKKIQQRYQQQVVLPHLNQKQSQLAQKKFLAQSIPVSQLIQHSKRHASMVAQVRQQRNRSLQQRSFESRLYLNSMPKSQFRFSVLQEEKLKLQYEIQAQNRKKQLITKQRHYSELVKQMFKPTVDQLKKREIEILKAKAQSDVKNGKSKSTESDIVIKKRVWKKNNMVPQPPIKREPVFIDYLAERRKVRENGQNRINLDWEREMEKPGEEEAKKAKILSIAQSIERKALQQEAKIRNFRGSKRKKVQDVQQMSDLLVDSIKAKLALLENS